MSRQETGGLFPGRNEWQSSGGRGSRKSSQQWSAVKTEKLTEAACGDPTPAPMRGGSSWAFPHTTLKPRRRLEISPKGKDLHMVTLGTSMTNVWFPATTLE